METFNKMNRITPQLIINFLCKPKAPKAKTGATRRNIWYHKYCNWRRTRWLRQNNWLNGNY